MNDATRYVPLDDIVVRTEGGQRIIDAYAAVFGVRAEIRDREGHYREELDRTSFDRTIAQRSGKFGVFYNHGLTIHGTPSERHSMPYGTPLSVRADNVGVMTSTQVANTDLGSEILELVEAGAIRGQSFSGRFLATRNGEKDAGLPVKIRTEVAMREYGLTPFPAYAEALVVGVRADLDCLSTDDLAAYVAGLPENERAALIDALSATADPGTGTEAPGPPDAVSNPHLTGRAAALLLLDLPGGPQ